MAHALHAAPTLLRRQRPAFEHTLSRAPPFSINQANLSIYHTFYQVIEPERKAYLLREPLPT